MDKFKIVQVKIGEREKPYFVQSTGPAHPTDYFTAYKSKAKLMTEGEARQAVHKLRQAFDAGLSIEILNG